MKLLLKAQAPTIPLTLLLAAVTGTVIAERSANACTLPRCTIPIRLFNTTSIPGDTVYFGILKSDPGVLSLETAEGQPIPASIRTIGGSIIFAPDSALPAELKVRLHYNEICGVAEVPEPKVFDFTTYDPRPYDPSPQQVAITERGIQIGSDYDTVFTRVGYWKPNEYGKFHHLVNVSASVDGWPYGSGISDGLTLKSSCAPELNPWMKDSCGNRHAAPPGKHTITFQATVLGFEPNPDPISITVDTSCVPLVPKGADPSSGCSMGTRSTPGAALMILGLVGMIALLSRSRRQQNKRLG